MSSFELSLTFNSDFLHESCFGLDSKTLHGILHFTVCFATEFCQGSSGEGEEMRAAFGLCLPSPLKCALPFSSAVFFVPLPSLLLSGILRNGHCSLGLSCVGEEAQVALGCLQFAP